MSKQTAVVVALWLLGAAGVLASIVAAVLLWRDVRDREMRRHAVWPDTTEEER